MTEDATPPSRAIGGAFLPAIRLARSRRPDPPPTERARLPSSHHAPRPGSDFAWSGGYWRAIAGLAGKTPIITLVSYVAGRC
ncbi:hypothetical protein ACI2K4_09545 [Micromonospora sp. NPDC050397]|uniref:hypothetical protein n=1 Tax=Micromonospora sp. NPDC050397 TaxID=3364279 RepID=UPI00385166AE